MQCTLSMIRALPDCDHTVFVFGTWTGKAQDVIGQFAKTDSGNSLTDLKEQDYDLVVYQNTADNRMLNKSIGFSVYVHHSSRKDSIKAGSRADLQLCVSYYLADKIGIGAESVLHQPVLESVGGGTKSNVFTIGRICNPRRTKWELSDVVEPIQWILVNADRELSFHFVGAPQRAVDALREILVPEQVRFSKADFSARSYIRSWHCMLNYSEVVETFGRTCREAQRVGCVPVVKRAGGYPEQICGDAGYAAESPEDASEYVLSLVKDNELYQQVSKRCADVGEQEGGLSVWRKRFLKRLRHEASLV